MDGPCARLGRVFRVRLSSFACLLANLLACVPCRVVENSFVRVEGGSVPNSRVPHPEVHHIRHVRIISLPALTKTSRPTHIAHTDHPLPYPASHRAPDPPQPNRAVCLVGPSVARRLCRRAHIVPPRPLRFESCLGRPGLHSRAAGVVVHGSMRLGLCFGARCVRTVHVRACRGLGWDCVRAGGFVGSV